MGVVPAGTKLAPKPPAIKDWDQLSADEKRLFARQAEVFAAFVEYTDHEIGRMLKAFEDVGQADNTLVFYIAGDNGTSGEGGQNGMFNEYTYFNGVQETVPDMLKLIDQWGGPETYPHMAAGWSVAFNSPFGWMKQVPSDFGGTRNGMVVHWPKGIKAKNGIRTQFSHVIDVAPTVLEAARPAGAEGGQRHAAGPDRGHEPRLFVRRRQGQGAPHHAVFRDRRQPRDLPRWLVRAHDPPAPWEPKPRRSLEDNSAWELYDVRSDFSLANDLAAKHPQKLKELQALFLRRPRSTTCCRWTIASSSDWTPRSAGPT
jgi:arylsulfatase A-like enzyme